MHDHSGKTRISKTSKQPKINQRNTTKTAIMMMMVVMIVMVAVMVDNAETGHETVASWACGRKWHCS